MDAQEFVFAPVHATTYVENGEDLFEESLTPACDFCLDTRVHWEYPCADFVLDDVKAGHLSFGSQGGWLACERCAERIEAGDFGGLAVRSLWSWIMRLGAPDQKQVDNLYQIQQGFFDHRTGPRTPFVNESIG